MTMQEIIGLVSCAAVFLGVLGLVGYVGFLIMFRR